MMHLPPGSVDFIKVFFNQSYWHLIPQGFRLKKFAFIGKTVTN